MMMIMMVEVVVMTMVVMMRMTMMVVVVVMRRRRMNTCSSALDGRATNTRRSSRHTPRDTPPRSRWHGDAQRMEQHRAIATDLSRGQQLSLPAPRGWGVGGWGVGGAFATTARNRRASDVPLALSL